MKHKMLRGSLLFVACLILCVTPYIQAETPAMPSVADVFGGMSEDEITKQVQLGQQFLEDLEKFGTAEEKAQFEQLLMDTLGSMSEDDFKDIQQIAQMVEPNLEFAPVEPQAPTPVAKEEKPTVQAEGSEVENFKTLISSIIQRIDDMLQKMNSSKECAQEVDTRWSSKATFNNMKRQIYQLRNTRLAQKLAKPDIVGDDKILVDTLKEFLKDLTKQNETFIVEDDFGLPASRQIEQKQLKKTKEILTMFDGYIDSLMPKLEKFLVKWDPEALQLAKEAEEKTTKALKDANDATVRRPSPEARPSAQQSPYGSPSSSRTGSAGSGYPGYGADYPYGYDQNGNYSGYDSGQPATGGTAATAGAAPKTTPKTAEPGEKRQRANDTAVEAYEDATDAIDAHLRRYDTKHEQEFNSFLTNVLGKYPLTSIPSQPDQPEGRHLQAGPDMKEWVDKRIEPYMDNVVTTLKNKFEGEFSSTLKVCDSVRSELGQMDSESAKKLTNYSGLLAIEQRLNRYKETYDKSFSDLKDQYKTNLDLLDDSDAKIAYVKQQLNFTNHLEKYFEDTVSKAKNEISELRYTIRRKGSRKKSAASTAVSNVINS